MYWYCKRYYYKGGYGKMKKKIIFLLVVSFMFLGVKTVNAAELKPVDEHTLDNIESTLTLDMKESEIDVSRFKNSDLDKIADNYENKLKEQGYDLTGIEVRIDFKDNISDGISNIFNFSDIHELDLSVVNTTNNNNNILYKKNIKVTYSNTASFNDSDKGYVEDVIKKMKFDGTMNDDIFNRKVDSIFRVYDKDEISYDDFFDNFARNYENYDYAKLVNDPSIKIRYNCGDWGTYIGANPVYIPINLYIYKNDVFYGLKQIFLVNLWGEKLNNGTPVGVQEIPKTENEVLNPHYQELYEEVKKQGLTDVLGCYELKAYGELYEGMEVSFNIDKKYEGREVKIFHKKNDGTYEVFTDVVKNGKVTVKVNEFSPFMVVLNNNDDVIQNMNNAPNNAQTSSMNLILYIGISLSSLVTIIYIIVKRKKKIA